MAVERAARALADALRPRRREVEYVIQLINHTRTYK